MYSIQDESVTCLVGFGSTFLFCLLYRRRKFKSCTHTQRLYSEVFCFASSFLRWCTVVCGISVGVCVASHGIGAFCFCGTVLTVAFARYQILGVNCWIEAGSV